jgi:signal transduction histidine kinase/CheY-like chemotaxis protein
MQNAAPQPVFDVFDALPDPAAILAADGVLLRANSAFRAAFRHLIGPHRPPWGRHPAPVAENGVRRFDAPAPDGRRFEWVEQVLADGTRLVIARDVTRHTEAADNALRAKTTLFATLTHELRTPLNGIIGMTDLLALGKLEPNAESYVSAIRQSGELLLDLITEILDYSRLEAGRVALESAPFDPEATMQDVAELLSPKAHSKKLEVAVIARNGAPTRVSGDDGRLRQILFNLAGNAVKFTAAGGVVIEMSPRPNQRLRFNVRDTGPGVAEDKQALIFEEFSQADAGVSRRYGGAGLGLAIVKKLAQAMGGEVGLVSKPGHGANFWVELPLAPVADDRAPLASLGGVRVRVETTSHVLAQAARAQILSLGAAVALAGEAADIALLDWRDDLDRAVIDKLASEVRAIIALVPQEERSSIEVCRQAGIVHYTLKPIRRRSLVERIKMALGQIEASATVAETASEPVASLAGMRVLLADDNPINALLARTLLQRAGCAVTVVQDGEEAVTAASKARYDLIFLDIRMPRLDGIGAAEQIKAQGGPSARTPMVALTADTGDDERNRAFKVGMVDFITKPIDAARFLTVAERFTGPANDASVSGR